MNWNYYANFPREQKLQAIIWMRWRIINSKCCWSMWNFLCPLLKTTTKWNKKIWEVNARNTSTDFCPRVTKTNWDADETLLSAKPLSWRNKLHYCSHPSWLKTSSKSAFAFPCYLLPAGPVSWDVVKKILLLLWWGVNVCCKDWPEIKLGHLPNFNSEL